MNYRFGVNFNKIIGLFFTKHSLSTVWRNVFGKPNYHGSLDKPYKISQKFTNTTSHPRYPDINLKLDAIKRYFSLVEGVNMC